MKKTKLFTLTGIALTLCMIGVRSVTYARAEEVIESSESAPITSNSSASTTTESISVTESITSLTSVIDEPKEPQIKDTLSQYWDQFIAPLFVGVTGTSIISAIVSIAVAIINRKNNKANKNEVTQSHNEVCAVASLASQMITDFRNILQTLESQNKISQEMKDNFINSSKQLLEKIAALTNKTEDLMKLKEIIITQTTINSKIALASKEVISSGLGEDIKLLSEQIKEL